MNPHTQSTLAAPVVNFYKGASALAASSMLSTGVWAAGDKKPEKKKSKWLHSSRRLCFSGDGLGARIR